VIALWNRFTQGFSEIHYEARVIVFGHVLLLIEQPQCKPFD